MPPRPRKPSAKLSNGLLDAITFLSCCTKDTGAPYETHINLQYNTAVAYNDILSAGVIIAEDIVCAPNASILKKALSKCGQEYTLTIDGNKIVLKSGKFKATISCIDPTILATRNPDPATIPINDDFKVALKVIDVLKPEPNADKIHLLAFLMNGQSVITTDGKIVIERWHGLELPTLAIPKSIIPAIVGTNKKLVNFGYSNTSVTFYFEDKSWIKSQLYDTIYPEMFNILNIPSNPLPIPVDFWNAIEAIENFSPDTIIHSRNGFICSHQLEGEGAIFECKDIPNMSFSTKQIKLIKSLATKIDFSTKVSDVMPCMAFFGDRVRGLIAGRK